MYVAVAKRDGEKRVTTWKSFALEASDLIGRQQEAAQRMLSYVLSILEDSD